VDKEGRAGSLNGKESHESQPLDESHAPDQSQPRDESQPKDERSAHKGVTRRSFLGQVGAAVVGASASPVLTNASPAQSETRPSHAPPSPTRGAVSVTLKINGQEHRLKLEPRVTLLDALRNYLQMFGTKKGCDHGQCGACTVHVNGRRVNSCLTFAIMHQGGEITTVEGLARNGELHPVQAAFVEHDAFQCGYCTSGQIMSAVALLREPCGDDDNSVRECMSGNICRCGAYPNIVAAVQQARKRA
jgi:xanthine dehydrogenase YagT iron-sulfur-binding subunit